MAILKALPKRSRIAIIRYKEVDDMEKVGIQTICAVTKGLLRLLIMPSNARANFLGRYEYNSTKARRLTSSIK